MSRRRTFTRRCLTGLMIMVFLALSGESVVADDWPMLLRDSHSGIGGAELKLSEAHLRQPKKLWQSEANIPPGRVADSRRAASNFDSPHSGGYASPIVADGRVFVYHYRPSGRVYDKHAVTERLKTTQEEMEKAKADFEQNKNRWPEVPGDLARKGMMARDGNLVYGHDRWLVEATDVLTCIDAKTGKTLWQTDLGDKGVNFNMFSKGGPGLTPAYHDGHVYVLGTGGHVYAVNAKSGKVVWTGDIGPRHQQQQGYREQAVAWQGSGPRYRSDFLSSVAVADGVVVVSDHRFHRVNIGSGMIYHHDPFSGYVAFDAKTGKKLGHLSGIGDGTTPILWLHQGKSYLIAAGRQETRLLELKSGKEIWKADFGHQGNHIGPSVGGEYMIVNHRTQAKDSGGPYTAYRLTLEGPKKLWELDPAIDVQTNFVIDGSRAYVAGRNVMLALDIETGKQIAAGEFPGGSGSSNNPFTIRYADWIIAMNTIVEGFSFLPADPEKMKQGHIDFPVNHAAAYEIAIMPAFSNGVMYVRTNYHVEAYQLTE